MVCPPGQAIGNMGERIGPLSFVFVFIQQFEVKDRLYETQ